MSGNQDIRILVVDDESINLKNIDHALKQEGYEIETASGGGEAVEKISRHHFDLIISDLKMPEVDGVQVMEAAQNMLPDAKVIIITGFATVNSAVETMAKGAFYYLPKPFKLKELRALVKKALEPLGLKNALKRSRQRCMAQKGVVRFIGQNPAILKLKDDIAQVAQLDCNVLITGETGTGKELVARTIYELSPRVNKRFLPINCGALTEELMLNELFGHEKDAFTGAGKSRKGLLESAGGGVVLLDEIGEMPLAMQVKLLRVLQEKKIIRVGGTVELPIDVRILAATNRDLLEEVKNGRFRQDLFYRLNVVSLHIAPLRERKDDIPQLVHHFLAKHPTADGMVKSVTPEALVVLQQYDYPGNVRELENIVERSLAMCNDREIGIHHLPRELGEDSSLSASESSARQGSAHSLAENERDYILSILKQADGNKSKAAKVIGIDRVSLWRKLKKYRDSGIDVEQFLSGK